MALFGLAILFALHMAMQEITVARAEAELNRTAARLDSPNPPSVVTITDLPLDSPPRALLPNALLHARLAQQSPDPDDRRRLLDTALAELDAMRGARPYWGEMWSTVAFVQSMRLGPESPATRNAVDRSYMDAPYLARAAPWRVAYGFRYWDTLNPGTRDRVVDEAVWLARSNERAMDSVMALARSSPAYEPFMVRWLASRVGDADFRSIEAPAP